MQIPGQPGNIFLRCKNRNALNLSENKKFFKKFHKKWLRYVKNKRNEAIGDKKITKNLTIPEIHKKNSNYVDKKKKKKFIMEFFFYNPEFRNKNSNSKK